MNTTPEPNVLDMKFEAWGESEIKYEYFTQTYFEDWISKLGVIARFAVATNCKSQNELLKILEEDEKGQECMYDLTFGVLRRSQDPP